MDNIYLVFIFILLFLYAICFYVFLIPILTKVKFKESIRVDGPRTHLEKKGTPTMGGIGFEIMSLVAIIVFYDKFNLNLGLSLNVLFSLFFPFLSYSILGLIDDYLKVIKNNKVGIKPIYKLLFQLIIAVIVYITLVINGHQGEINFFGTIVNFQFFYAIILIFMFLLFTNGTNLTDGIDGLLSFNAIINILGFIILSFILNNNNVLIFNLAIFIPLLGFTIFNMPKAKIFMGDTGSLALGGSFVISAIYLRCEVLLFIMGIIYIIEALSVFLQVFYFKRTKGKRLFKMTPIHHHFELSSLKDYQIDLLFSLVTFIATYIAIRLGGILF